MIDECFDFFKCDQFDCHVLFVVQAKQVRVCNVRVSAICDMSDGSPEHLRYELQS